MKAPSVELGTIGDFEILGKIGAGGMGAVYKARQISLDRLVALKVLPSQFADDPDYIGRFQREAKVASGLHHDNLVGVYSYGVADGVHYIAMELVEGENLHQLLRHRRVDMAEALGITVYVAQGLKCGWDTAQLVHRDIKPSNIYVSHDGHVKVGDLGLAKSLTSNTTGITHTGTMMGTPHYMSPEQCRGDKTIDFRADIYSLGCMLFEMLTGHPPYPGSDPVAIVNKHLHGPPPGLLKDLPGCPMPVALLVGRMLKKAPRERHASYAELIAEIEALYEHLERGEALDPAQFRRPVQRAAPASTVSEGMPDWVYWAVGVLILVAILVIFLPKPEKKLAELADKAPKPVAATTTPRVSPIAAATPVAQAPHLPAGTPAPPASGALALQPAFGPWQPLFTEAEWKQNVPGQREVVDGRVHLLGPAVEKPQSAADGAIRARIQYQPGSNAMGFTARVSDVGRYKLSILNDRSLGLRFFAGARSSSANMHKLGEYYIPKPLQPGATLLLELRLQGDRLTALVDGAVVIDARDSRLTAPGEWGITAGDGWFESVEVQTPLPAGPPIVATKDAPFENTLGMKFVPVPIVGGPTAGKTVLFSVWETRVQDYEVFATETKRAWPKPAYAQEPTHPTVTMNWDDATAFCAWLTERERKAGRLPAGALFRLPSDHEWSCAVGIGTQEDPAKLPSEKSSLLSNIYPWGGAWPPGDDAGNYSSAEVQGMPIGVQAIATRHDGYGATAPVGSYRANALGLYDLGGNVWEWCEDWIDQEQRKRVMRGASFTDTNSFSASATRTARVPTGRESHCGFRVALAVAAPPTAVSAPSASAVGGWQDLLAPLTPELLAKTGDGWRLQDGALHSPDKKFALLPLTDRYAGTSYQLRVKLRQLKPTEGFAIVLPVADRMVGFAVDGWPSTGFYTSLNLVNGQFGDGLPGSLKGQQIRDSEPHELEVTVRLEGANLNFNAGLDGRPLYSWLGPIAALSQSDSWRKTPPGTLAFGTMADIWAVSEVKVKRLAP